MKKSIIGLIVICSLAGIWQLWAMTYEKDDVVPEYNTERVTRGDLAVSLAVDGKMMYEKWELDFLNTGVVDNVNVKLGDVLKKGQTLASIDIERNRSLVSQAESTLSASDIDLNRLSKDGVDYKIKKKAYDDAQDQLRREKDLYDEYVRLGGDESTQALAQKIKVSSAQSDVNNAKYQMKQIEESYKKAQYEFSKNSSAYEVTLTGTNASRIVSPRGGIVVDAINGKVGDAVSQSNSNTNSDVAFLTLINPENLWFEALVEDIDALKIEKDMSVSVTLDAYPEREFEARVEFVSFVPEVDVNGLSNYKVIIRLLQNDDTKFLNEMSGSAEIISKEVQDVVMISNTAVKNIAGQQTVVVKDGDTLGERMIVTGFTNGKKVEVKSGLNPGEEIVIIR